MRQVKYLICFLDLIQTFLLLCFQFVRKGYLRTMYQNVSNLKIKLSAISLYCKLQKNQGFGANRSLQF